jgi:glycerol-3-phosphate dehydrogenase
LNALPRVVDIMAEELDWSLSRKRQELKNATAFLASMGLPSGAKVPEIEPRGLLEHMESALWWGISGHWILGGAGRGSVQTVMYSRAQFEAGEIDTLRAAFEQRAAFVSPIDNGRGTEEKNVAKELRLKKEDVQALLKDLPGYEGVRTKDFEYVLEEAGLGKRVDLDFDEFVEVCGCRFICFPLDLTKIGSWQICGGLKEVSIPPDFESKRASKLSRRRIPVEKSGGGV